jgi:3-hydroxyisobutyrate dehydrogenase
MKDQALSQIAFIGTGRMGLGMAHRLLSAGYRLRVFNRTRSKADSLTHAGAHICATPREACTEADAIVAMTADDRSSRAVWRAPDGVLAGTPAAGALAIECSTLSHGWAVELGSEATRRGLRYIDAPVTGLPDDAAQGRLTLLVGADSTHLEAARPLLSVMATRILRFGDVGAGSAYKLIVNMMGAVQIASAAEGMAIAERAGLDLSAVADAIALGQAASPQVMRNTRRMAAGDHETNVVFTPALRLKDVEYALALSDSLGIGSPFGHLARDQLRRVCALGYASANESKIIDVARTQAVQPSAAPESAARPSHFRDSE